MRPASDAVATIDEPGLVVRLVVNRGRGVEHPPLPERVDDGLQRAIPVPQCRIEHATRRDDERFPMVRSEPEGRLGGIEVEAVDVHDVGGGQLAVEHARELGREGVAARPPHGGEPHVELLRARRELGGGDPRVGGG